jgi:serine/threonine protein kinase
VGLPGIINAVVNRSHRFDANVKVSESGREFIDLCLDKDANKRVSILTLKDHPWFQEGVDLNRTSEDRQEAISTSLKDERSAGVTLCKLMLFGVFEQHLKKMVETMQLSE